MERLGTKALLAMLGDWSAGEAASLQQRLVLAFSSAIETGVLVPGTVLPAERTLARTLGVSRSTVTATLAELKASSHLEARQGSGTVVCGRTRSTATLIDLASSSPADARALPEVDVDLDALLRAGSRDGLTPAGLPELREAVAHRFSVDGLETRASEIVITNGAQHALALAFAHLASPGDPVIVDEPTYPGVVDLLAARGLRPIPLPRSHGNIDGERLVEMARLENCQLAYLQTSVHNPTGLVADAASLAPLAAQIADLDLTVVEDLVLADLRFDGSRLPPLASLLPSAVVVGSVSKLGWGGLRIGWLRGPRSVVDPLIDSRLTDDLGSSVPSQVISAAVLQNFEVIVDSRQRTLARRAELAGQVLDHSGLDWTMIRPQGGLSLWIDTRAAPATRLAQSAAENGVVIAEGAAASVDQMAGSFIRVCFDRPVPQLEEGLRRLVAAASHSGY